MKQSNLGKGHTTLRREKRRREVMAEVEVEGRRGCTTQHWVNDLLYEILRNKWERGEK